MKRFSIRGGFALSLLAGAVACSQNAAGAGGVTNSESVVSGCQKVGEVTVGSLTPARDVDNALTEAAHKQGGNYVLVGSEGARTGTAYRCAMPTGGSATAN
ncbi:MAG: hypothetical protein ABI592_12795 [Acidobacteriota bacterium]